MTNEEFVKQKRLLQKEFKRKQGALAKEYALSNNTVKVGDIVTDHIGSIKVDKIAIHGLYDPCCIYYGVRYTTRGKPFKNGERRGVYQTNLTKSR